MCFVLSAGAALAEEAAPRPAPASRKAPPKPAVRVHAPVGGRSFSIEDIGVVCGRIPGPWRTVGAGRFLIPPSSSDAIGKPTVAQVAPTAEACEQEGFDVSLIATGAWPRLDTDSVVLSVDEGRADARGQLLEGAVLRWQSRDASGTDVCQTPGDVDGQQSCTWSTGRAILAHPDETRVGIYPQGSQPGPGARFYDPFGRPIAETEPVFKPARVVIQRMFPADASVDLAAGFGQLSLLHPESVATASCEPLDCEMEGSTLTVRAGATPVERVEVTLRLRPRVQVRDGERLGASVSGQVAILHCPMSIVSGSPFRDNVAATVAVRMEGTCARELPELEFRVERRRLSVIEVHHDAEGTVALLDLGAIAAEGITITAHRRGTKAAVIAVTTGATRRVPPLRAVLEVPGFPNVDFIPTNRWANVHVPSPGDDVQVVALPIAGVYETRIHEGRSQVKGDPNAAGLTGLRLGLRSKLLPESLVGHDVAVVEDPLLRSVHEARVPAPLLRGKDDKPLIELICGTGPPDNKPLPVPVGELTQLPYERRDNCHIVFHRSRLRPKLGAQRLRLEIDVYSLGGGARGDAHVNETLTLRPGPEPRTAYVDGVIEPFDHLVVRVFHVADDTYYLGASEVRTGVPAAKWSVVFGTDVARLYATTAFPTGLYRLSDRDHSGILSLNFGLLSRLTWLDSEGNEGFLGLEAGLVVIGLGNAVTDNGANLSQVGAVIGLGLSVPFANRSTSVQAAINVHAWLEIDVTLDRESGEDGRYAFIFGPSISIGNLGTNL